MKTDAVLVSELSFQVLYFIVIFTLREIVSAGNLCSETTQVNTHTFTYMIEKHGDIFLLGGGVPYLFWV